MQLGIGIPLSEERDSTQGVGTRSSAGEVSLDPGSTVLAVRYLASKASQPAADADLA